MPVHLAPQRWSRLAGERLRTWCRAGGRACSRLVLPPRCVRCDVDLADPGADELPLCPTCIDLLVGEKAAHSCPRCGTRLSRPIHGRSCPACVGRRFAFQTVIPLGSYHDELRQAILEMKKPAGNNLSAAVGRLLARKTAIQLVQFHADVIVPIPMYWSHRLRRRTNSPEILAAEISLALGVPIEHPMLVRWRKTLPQNDLTPFERWENVRGAFRLAAGYIIDGAKVILVDDVLTTGATCNEAAKTLRRAGARSVIVAVAARTEQPA
ncbi:MAG: ComF family protein [Pirellulales bacterium]|nr:ComF family protein [Pirellulales bacterium]